DDLLHFSSINHEAVKVESFAPKEVFQHIIKDLASDIEAKGAVVKIGPLPSSIAADKNLLHLVFQNLIANGIKFVSPNVKPQIEVAYTTQQEDHVFLVKDNGIGIAPEHQQKVFKLFKRLHRVDAYQGTGIGLSICRKVMEKHQGTITIESELKKGSTFFVRLPKCLDN
ncbi:MAG: ATP-binding protein, partial [Bacteroidota bacterium]